MVKLNRIYTRTGDDGTTGLGSGERRLKHDLRVEAYGTVDEANAFRNEWMDRLEQAGIATRQGTHALHTLGYYAGKYGYRHEDLPGAYACDRLSLAIPLYVEMTEDDQDYVIEQMAVIAKELLKEKQ